MKRLYTHSLILFVSFLMISCGSADIDNVGGQTLSDSTVARGMNVGESENFITTIETLNQDDEVKSVFGTEVIKLRVSVMNKSELDKILRFRNGSHKAKIEIYNNQQLVWTSRDFAGIQLIEEKTLLPNDRLEFILKWNLLDRAQNIVSPGKYHVLTKVMSEEDVPAPGIVELVVR